MTDSRNLLIVVATYNEIDSLPALIQQLDGCLPQASLLIIDDNSPDGTGQWCDQRANDDKRLAVIHRAGKLGLGTAAILGLTHAIEHDFELVATMDADLSHDPQDLRLMFERMNGASATTGNSPDLLIGSRYVSGGQIIGWPFYRRLSSYLVNEFTRFALGLATRDNTSAFRIYEVAALRKIDLSAIQSHGYSYLEEILLLLHHSNANFEEFAITFHDRESGRSKVNLFELARSLYQILRLSLS